MSKLTEGWKTYSLRDLVVDERPICYGVLKPGDFIPDGVPLVRIVDVANGQIDLAGLHRISATLDAEFRRSKLLGGEVLVSIQGTIGRAAVAPQELAGANISRTIARIAVNDFAISGFLSQWLRSPYGQRALDKSVLGTTRDSLNIGVLRRIDLAVPPVPEQRKITEILDTADEVIRSTERLITKLEQAKRGLINDLLTRGIDESGQLRDPTRHPDQFVRTCIGLLPEAWQQVSIGQISSSPESFIQTGPFGSQLHANEYVTEGTPVVMPQDIYSGEVNTSRIARIDSIKAAELNRHRMQAGDIVFARRGDLSKCAAITSGQEGWLCGTGCLLLRPPTSLSSSWLAELYRHAICQRQIAATAVGTTMVNLNTKLVGNLRIPLPSSQEQRRISDVIAAEETRIIQAKGEVEKFCLLKQGLMDDLLMGRVRVGAPA
jgi:type I restriction enzyme S subunit